MSLQLWLPLNGDLHNQGLNKMTVSNHNATIDNNGKIGKCYYFNGDKQWLQLSNNLGDFYNNDWSLCTWIKPTDITRSIILSEYNGTGASNVAIELTTNRTVRVYWNGSPDIILSSAGALPLNEWTHLVVTKKGSVFKVYYNGITKQIYTYNGTLSTRTSACQPRIGDDYRGNSANTVSYQGYLCDFRLYNHCLSAKEVDEISRGLILHYKMDLSSYTINPNLLQDTNVNGLTKVAASYDRYYESVNNGSYTNTWFSLTNAPIPGLRYGLRETVTSVSGIHSVTWYKNGYVTVTNQPYTMSCYVRVLSGTDLNFKFQYGKNPYISKTIKLKNDDTWHQYSWTFTPDTASGKAAAGGTTRIYCGGLASIGSVEICGWKLETGQEATPWCEYNNTTTITNNIIYDSSGYGNHATIVGTITADNTSPRYETATAMNAVSSTDHIECNNVLTIPTDGITVSFWWYPLQTSTYVAYIDQNMSFAVNSAGTAFYLNRTSSAGFPTTNLKVNQWNHITLIRNNTNYYAYINGVSIPRNQGNNYWSHQVSNIYLFNRQYKNNYGANGKMSDFRMYATCLTEAQILDLYRSRAAIDNHNNMYMREEIENTSNLNLNTKGQFYNIEIIESATAANASISAAKTATANNIYEY